MVVNLENLRKAKEIYEKERKKILQKQEELHSIMMELPEIVRQDEWTLQNKTIEQEMEKISDELLMICVALERMIETYEKAETNIIKNYDDRMYKEENVPIQNILKNISEKKFHNVIFKR